MWRYILIFAIIGDGLCNIFDLSEFDDPLSVFYNPRNVLSRQHHGRCTGTLNANQMEGICLSRPECHFSSGSVAVTGDCTLGICCVYTNGCNKRSNKRISYFNQTGTIDNSCVYIVDVENSNICQMRIDFEQLNLSPPTFTAGTTGVVGDTYGCINDYFEILSPNNNYIPTICGNNNGQHMYVTIDRATGQNQMRMKVSINSAIANVNRNWRIKVTQLECPGPSKHQKSRRSYEDFDLLAPNGCLQYHLNRTGEIRSFGFDNITVGARTDKYPPNMDYAICFRRFPDTCGIEFTVNNFDVGKEQLSTECADFLFVPDSTLIPPDTTATSGQYCGDATTTPAIDVGTKITSTTPGPLYVRFKTNNIYDSEFETGFSLTYIERSGNTC